MAGFMHGNGSMKRLAKLRPPGNPKDSDSGCALIFILIGLLGFLAVLLNL